MALRDWVAPAGAARVATATTATTATVRPFVATVATVAVAGGPDDRHFRWRVAIPGRTFEVRTSPEMTADEVRELYPGARIEPIPERAGRVATNAEAAELRALVRVVLTDAPQEWDEAHRLGCADIEDALLGWRSCLIE